MSYLRRALCTFALGLLSNTVFVTKAAIADTFYEVGLGVHQAALEIGTVGVTPEEDNSSSINASLAAYRKASDRSFWGAVIEVNSAIGREDNLPGSGLIKGFRPVNYLRYLSPQFAFELYGGIAQYEWEKSANGYYFGAGFRYQFEHLGIAFDTKYYRDLAYDRSGGDIFVNGFNPGLKVFYRF